MHTSNNLQSFYRNKMLAVKMNETTITTISNYYKSSSNRTNANLNLQIKRENEVIRES